MRYVKLNREQRRIKHWRERPNAVVSKLLDADPRLSRVDALRMANRQMRKEHA